MLAALLLLLANPALDSMVEAERAFARLSAEKGIRAAFLEYLGEGSVVFRPEPVDARPVYAARPDPPAVLEWEPAFVDISGSGDLGYSTGPWSLRSKATPPRPPAFGHFVSVWRRGKDGRWRVALDCGISHAESARPARVEIAGGGSDPRPGTKVEELLALDRRFTPALAAAGIRVYRPGRLPVTGAAALEEVRKSSGPGDPQGGGIASSGELGYTYGIASTPLGRASCLRIWKRRGGAWKAVLEVLDPLPEPAQK